MDKNCCSSSPDSVISLMSTVPVDTCTKVKVSGDKELPLTAQNSGSGNLVSSEPVFSESDAGDSCKNEFSDWKKVSYFNPTTGTSIIRITSEMFNKSRASSSQAEQNSSVEVADLTQQCDFEPCSDEVRTRKEAKQEALLSSVVRSSGAGVLFKGGCFGEGRSFETLHDGHSLDSLGDGKVECDSDMYTSDLLYIDEPEYDDEEKVISIGDKEEQTAWESVASCQVKEPTNDLRDNKSVDIVKDLGSSATQLPRKESSLQAACEKVSRYLTETCVDKNKTEMGFTVGAAIDVTESAKSGFQENRYHCSLVTDYDKTINISSSSTSLGVEASDKNSKSSPGPLQLTRLVKSNAQQESSHPSLFSACHRSDANVNNTVRQSITSILSLDSRTNSSDGAKGWNADRSLFAPDLPESSCRAVVASESWAELEDSHTHSFELRTSPEKMTVDDLLLSKTDGQTTSGGCTETLISGGTNRYVPSSYVELNHVDVGHIQSEKLKLMQNRKEKRLNRRKAGLIDSSQISGNKGKCSIEELLDFINSKETEHGKSRKTTSQKGKKQVTRPNKSQMKFVIKVTVTEETQYNSLPDATDAVPNGLMTQNKTEEFAHVKEVEGSLKDATELPNDSSSVTIRSSASNGFVQVQEESKVCPETAEKLKTDSSLADAVNTVSNGFQESEEPEGSARVEKENREDKAVLQAPSANDTVSTSLAASEQALTDAVTVTSSSFRCASDSSGETIATDEAESNKDFTVVQKKKRNKTTHAEKSQTYRAKVESSLDTGRSRMKNVRKVGNNLKAFPLKHNQLAVTVDSRRPVHSTWGALLKGKPVKADVLGKSSSGDSSETSSVCSASVQRESTPFTKVALGSTASDTNSHSVCKNSEASVCLHNGETRTLQSAKSDCKLQLNANTSCNGITKPVLASDQHDFSSHSEAVTPSSTDDGSREDFNTVTFTESRLGGDLDKVSLPKDDTASFQSSASCQEMKLSSTAVTESSRASGRPTVVFDTREKSRFLTPASDIEISFGFDANVDDDTPQTKAERTDFTAIPTPQEDTSNSMHCPQLASDLANCSVAVDINCNHPHFQGAINKSAVIALPSHGFPSGASLIYSSPHHLSQGVGYVVPVPIGIVPPFVMCNSRQPTPAMVVPRPAFESKDFVAPPELPGVSVSEKQEQEQSCPAICELVPAQPMVLSGPQELSNTKRPKSSKLEDICRYFDLVAAQSFLYSAFEDATSPGSGIVYLTIDD